jgi:hypothetical protein
MSTGDPRHDVAVFAEVVHALADRLATRAEVLAPYGLAVDEWQRIVDEWMVRLVTDLAARRRFEAAYAAAEAHKQTPTRSQRGLDAALAAPPAGPPQADETAVLARVPLFPPLPFDPRARPIPPPPRPVEPSEAAGETAEISRSLVVDPATTLPFKKR